MTPLDVQLCADHLREYCSFMLSYRQIVNSFSDWFSKPSQTRHMRSNRTRPSREGSRSHKSRNSSTQQSNQSIPSRESNKSLQSEQSGGSNRQSAHRVMSVDDMIDHRISQLGLPGLEGNRYNVSNTVTYLHLTKVEWVNQEELSAKTGKSYKSTLGKWVKISNPSRARDQRKRPKRCCDANEN